MNFRVKYNLIILFIFITFIIIGLFILQQSLDIIKDKVLQEQSQILTSVNTNVVKKYQSEMESLLKLLSADSKLVNVFNNPESKKQVLNDWQFSQTIFPERAWIYYGNKNKQILTSPTWDSPETFNCTTRPWYLEAQSSNQVVWPEIFADYVTGEYVLTASIAIYKNNMFEGVLAIDTFISSEKGIVWAFQLLSNGTLGDNTWISNQWEQGINDLRAYNNEGNRFLLVNKPNGNFWNFKLK